MATKRKSKKGSTRSRITAGGKVTPTKKQTQKGKESKEIGQEEGRSEQTLAKRKSWVRKRSAF